MEYMVENDILTIDLVGRIDSSNAKEIEEQMIAIINENLNNNQDKNLVLNLAELTYISSAGLRALIKIKKLINQEIVLQEASQEIYDILEMTGFDQLFTVKKKMRTVSVDGLEVIGKGFYGTVYRIDADTIIKVYESPDAINIIENEKKMAKMAFLKGVPTAISFDIVKVGDSYGSVFELLDAKTFNDLLIEDPGNIDKMIPMYCEVMKNLHDTEVEPGVVPLARDVYLGSLERIKNELPDDIYEKLKELLSGMEDDYHLVHGDIQMKNVMLTDGEPMLIDMDTLSTGQPEFDLSGIYVTYQAFKEDDPENSMSFLGIPDELCDGIWNGVLKGYYGDDEELLKEKTRLVKILGSIRFLSIITGDDFKPGELEKVRIARTIEHLKKLL